MTQQSALPWYMNFRPAPLMPWQTAKGQGFIAPWSRAVQTPGGISQYDPQALIEQTPKVTYSGAKLLEDIGYPFPKNTRVADPTVQELLKQRQSGGGLGGTPSTGLQQAVRWGTITENGWDYTVGYDANGMEISREPLGRTGGGAANYAPTGSAPSDPYGRQAHWDADNAEWRYPPDWGTDPATQKAGYIDPYQQAMIEYQNQMMSMQQRQFEQNYGLQQAQFEYQKEAERQSRLSQLRANPASWLEYASFAGETPGVQPWMLPLMPQEYSGLQAGASLPGWTPNAESLSSLPALTPPSAQYLSRLPPSAIQQYYGYEKARTGQAPSDVEWRQWGSAPPGAGSRGLNWTR